MPVHRETRPLDRRPPAKSVLTSDPSSRYRAPHLQRSVGQTSKTSQAHIGHPTRPRGATPPCPPLSAKTRKKPCDPPSTVVRDARQTPITAAALSSPAPTGPLLRISSHYPPSRMSFSSWLSSYLTPKINTPSKKRHNKQEAGYRKNSNRKDGTRQPAQHLPQVRRRRGRLFQVVLGLRSGMSSLFPSPILSHLILSPPQRRLSFLHTSSWLLLRDRASVAPGLEPDGELTAVDLPQVNARAMD